MKKMLLFLLLLAVAGMSHAAVIATGVDTKGRAVDLHDTVDFCTDLAGFRTFYGPNGTRGCWKLDQYGRTLLVWRFPTPDITFLRTRSEVTL
jgi:hypothetical protein